MSKILISKPKLAAYVYSINVDIFSLYVDINGIFVDINGLFAIRH